MKNRKIIQLMYLGQDQVKEHFPVGFVALCDDGTIWMNDDWGKSWEQILDDGFEGEEK